MCLSHPNQHIFVCLFALICFFLQSKVLLGSPQRTCRALRPLAVTSRVSTFVGSGAQDAPGVDTLCLHRDSSGPGFGEEMLSLAKFNCSAHEVWVPCLRHGLKERMTLQSASKKALGRGKDKPVETHHLVPSLPESLCEIDMENQSLLSVSASCGAPGYVFLIFSQHSQIAHICYCFLAQLHDADGDPVRW